MMDTPQHFMRKYVRDSFGLNDVGATRLADFLLAHVLVDIHLIGPAIQHEIRSAGGQRSLSFEDIQTIADGKAKGTFHQHLDRVKRLGLFPAQYAREFEGIASEINDARNAILHWPGPKKSRHPIYKGKDVTTEEEGLSACLEDVLKFVQQMGPLSVLT